MSSIITPEQPAATTSADISPAKMVYWKLNGRGTFPYLVAALGGVPVTWDYETAQKWPAPQAETPFGLLPVLHSEGIAIAESMAIVRYLGRKGSVDSYHTGNQVDDLRSYGISEMVTEKATDMFHDFISNKWEEKSYDAYVKFFAEKLPVHFAQLERLLGDRPFLSGDTALQGDAVLFATIYIMHCCNDVRTDAALATAPGILAWKTRFSELSGIPEALEYLKTVDRYFYFPEVDLE